MPLMSQTNEISMPRKIICDGINIEFQIHYGLHLRIAPVYICLVPIW